VVKRCLNFDVVVVGGFGYYLKRSAQLFFVVCVVLLYCVGLVWDVGELSWVCGYVLGSVLVLEGFRFVLGVWCVGCFCS